MLQITVLFLLPDLAGGGAQRVMLTLAGGLNRTLFAPQLAVIGTADMLRGDVMEDVPVVMGQAARLRSGLPWLIKTIRELQPDIVVSTLAYTNLALLAVKPLLPRDTQIVVREANTSDATIAAMPSFVPTRQLYRSLYPRAARVIAQTTEIAASLTCLSPGIAGKVDILGNPVQVDALRLKAARPRRDEGRGLRLVAAGRLTAQKGFDRLIRLAPSLPADCCISIFGDGSERSALQSEIDALGLGSRVTLYGFTGELSAHMAGADALVIPSRWEGLPNVALEALALGTPVIASPEAALHQVASQGGAVTIAQDDAGFIGAIAALPTSGKGLQVPRPSLLPAAYDVRAISAQFEHILTEVVATA